MSVEANFHEPELDLLAHLQLVRERLTGKMLRSPLTHLVNRGRRRRRHLVCTFFFLVLSTVPRQGVWEVR